MSWSVSLMELAQCRSVPREPDKTSPWPPQRRRLPSTSQTRPGKITGNVSLQFPKYGSLRYTVKLQIFVRYPFSYFWLETGSYELIFVLSRASKQNYIEIRWPQDKINFHPVLNFTLLSKVRKYEIKYRTKICDFTVTSDICIMVYWEQFVKLEQKIPCTQFADEMKHQIHMHSSHWSLTMPEIRIITFFTAHTHTHTRT